MIFGREGAARQIHPPAGRSHSVFAFAGRSDGAEQGEAEARGKRTPSSLHTSFEHYTLLFSSGYSGLEMVGTVHPKFLREHPQTLEHSRMPDGRVIRSNSSACSLWLAAQFALSRF